MLPGKKYTPEDILQVLWRYKWVLLVPFAVISAGTAVYARYLPDRFRSEALIMVQAQKVPTEYVRPATSEDIQARIRSIREEILSRPQLERVITDFNLYAAERRSGAIMQDIVERMQSEVVVTPGAGDTFRVGFIGENPVVVRNVAQKLQSMFIDESIRQRASLADSTSQFLDAQLAAAGARLREHEKSVADYRNKFGAELPAHLESNLQAISNAQMQMQALQQAINQSQNQRLLIERSIADLEMEAQAPALPPTAGAIDGNPRPGMTAAEQLVIARSQLALMLQTKRPNHPDIIAANKIIADIQKRADAEALRMPLSGPAAALSPRERRLADLRTQLALLDKHIADQKQEEGRLRATAAAYQQRVEMTPARETEMIELTRDYGMLEKLYASLLSKREEARLSSNLERLQIGESLTVLDSARLPERPFSPNRQVYNFSGMGVGLALGLVFVGLLEYRDRSFQTDDEVKGVLGLPVLAVVPLMRSTAERRLRRRRGLVVNFVLSGAVLTCAAVVTYTFVR